MMDDPVRKSSGIGSMALRIFIEFMIWLPAVLALTISLGVRDRVVTLGIVLLFIVLGLLLYRFPPLWRRIIMILAFLALVGIGIGRYTNLLPVFAWLGIVLWRGRFVKFGHWHYGLAFCICCAGLIINSNNGAGVGYRIFAILLAVVWVAIWFYALNRHLVENAGVHSGIVTKPVRTASRKYLLVFLAIGAVVIALTAGYGERWLTPKQANIGTPVKQIQEPLLPPIEPMEIPEWMEDLVEEQGEPSVIWEYLFWALMAIGACGVIWFLRLGWKDRKWTWRSLMRKVREWFLREKREEELPYVEERRSLKKEKPGRRGLNAWFRKNEPRKAWERLSNSEKVRHLYEEAVLAGIREGYGFKPSDTPTETLDGIERWHSGRKAPVSGEQAAAYWSWLLSVRRSLANLYGKAKYSPHDIASREVGELREGRPGKQRPEG
ncbi:hypothetical protein [Cohnella cholangitidis]|uniref:DUF4129 domain-containing protein n=1 Tax=Cohnella cholangitidis TaxID=2598458 RepID=A0A7G5BZZ7_9BACL|nr:hypothetical protein [Cohnella cholangitidis]QMV42531.1 hypothetical protein FPL14_15975 [Cohnella cholangitidis]